jgi:hypothetical protein
VRISAESERNVVADSWEEPVVVRFPQQVQHFSSSTNSAAKGRAYAGLPSTCILLLRRRAVALRDGWANSVPGGHQEVPDSVVRQKGLDVWTFQGLLVDGSSILVVERARMGRRGRIADANVPGGHLDHVVVEPVVARIHWVYQRLLDSAGVGQLNKNLLLWLLHPVQQCGPGYFEDLETKVSINICNINSILCLTIGVNLLVETCK